MSPRSSMTIITPHVASGCGAIKQNELAQLRVDLCDARRSGILHGGLEREVVHLYIAGDIALKDLQEVLRCLLCSFPGVLLEVEQHEARGGEHAEGRDDAQADPQPWPSGETAICGEAKARRSRERFSLRQSFMRESLITN